MASTFSVSQPPVRRHLWLQRFIAIIALVNLLLVCFDLSYIPWRDFYLQKLPAITQQYDRIKGIEPHRETQQYLNKVNALEQQVMQNGLRSPEVASSLSELQFLSNQMIEDNPFALSNQSGHLEKIKNQMRDRVRKESAHIAFETFWSQAYLSQAGWQQEIDFFNTQTRPLIETNYYRHLGINGKFVDNFWWIDLPFVILFSLDFLVRTFFISRRNPQLSWLQAMLRHWYDIFLLLPFYRGLRVLPVAIRLHQANLINLNPIREQINYDLVANLAQELAEVVGVRMIDQMQASIQRGDVTRWLFHPETRRPYVDINNTNEVQAIATRLLHLSVYQVIPQIQPDIEALAHQVIQITLNQSPVYQQIQKVPGLGQLPTQLTENLAKDLSQTAYKTLTAALEDPAIAKLTNRLVKNFEQALEAELQKTQNQQAIQSLIIDLLEEVKINYVKDIEEAGVEQILEESSQLRRLLQD